MIGRRVVVTGLGMVSPLGLDVAETWANILNGNSGIRPITHFDVSGFPTRFGGSVEGFDANRYMASKEARKMDAFVQYGIAAAGQALVDSGLEISEENAERIGVAIGSGIGGLPGIEKGHSMFLKGGPRKISPFFVPSNIINMVSGHFAILHDLKGPNIAIVTACTTGTHNIGEAARIIRYGDADVMFAGGAEMATCPMGVGGFSAARALSTRNDSPQQASRPWDRDRDGFVLSDGAGVIALEDLDHAQRRGAHIYAEVAGFGLNADAYHMTAPSVDGDGARRCMAMALRDAEMTTDDIDYVNAHGTSTPAGDLAESDAVKRCFGEHARDLAISSTKSMVGHMLGAAGGCEAIFSILAIRDETAPPTINLDNPDPRCDLNYVPHTAREMKLDAALSNSFGFGGTNGTLIFKRFR